MSERFIETGQNFAGQDPVATIASVMGLFAAANQVEATANHQQDASKKGDPDDRAAGYASMSKRFQADEPYPEADPHEEPTSYPLRRSHAVLFGRAMTLPIHRPSVR
jgi:hypothetical protein